MLDGVGHQLGQHERQRGGVLGRHGPETALPDRCGTGAAHHVGGEQQSPVDDLVEVHGLLEAT